MPLLQGPMSFTLLKIRHRESEFKPVKFEDTGRQVSNGFLPYNQEDGVINIPGGIFLKYRCDKKVINAAALKEAYKSALQAESAAGAVMSKRFMARVKQACVEDALEKASIRTTIVECFITKNNVWVGTASDGVINDIMFALRDSGLDTEIRTPWTGDEEFFRHPGLKLTRSNQSMYGPYFATKILVNSPDAFVEGDKGSVRLITDSGVKVSLEGALTNDLDRYLSKDALILKLKLCFFTAKPFMFDAVSFRISGLQIKPVPSPGWQQTLIDRVSVAYPVMQSLYELYHKNKHLLREEE